VRAIDTNIVIRLLTADDPEQAQAAKAIVTTDATFLGITVLLETEWVLRAGYGFTVAQVAGAFRALAGITGLTIEEPAQVVRALDWLEDGMDFADALHLARSSHCQDFVTFDRKFARRAAGVAPIPVTLL
jgi:predicted nucleic-acid-binding protein